MNDITVQKQYNDTLKKYSDKKNSILNILSHDLAGPLGMIGSLADVLQSDLKSHQNEKVHNLIRLIQKNSQQGVQLIQEFIRQEFLESAGVELIRQRVDLVQVLRESMEEYQQSQNLIQKTFHYHTSGEIIFVNLDDNKFMQVINNLISNAIKFTNEHGLIQVHIEKLEKSALVTVTDNGIGIPKHLQPLVFHKYTEAARNGLDGQETIGLGMWIVKSFTEVQGGRVWFESEENKGTKIYVEFPLGEFEEMEG